MTFILFFFGAAVAAGLFFITADLLKLPRLSTEKALLSAGKREKKQIKSIDTLFLDWAIKLSKYICMDEYKRHQLERTLAAAGMDMTPEVYTAYTMIKPGAVLLGIIPCLLILPLLSPVMVLLAILLYFKESRKADEKLAARRDKIEAELPRFVATIEQELGASRDIVTILENYKRHAGPDFTAELDVLTADMRSSSYEAALIRFEGRIGSPMLSDIVRGLISVLRGDDGRIYFQMLSHDMKQLELQRLKAQAAKIPPKIRVFSFIMLVCFMLIYIVVIVLQILTSLGGLF
ncbi:secretion protein F [uncultured Oscillibacter sp.]|uniref:secretion protein F n=1 Tax=uncultured Oscillibacter sp. TaxID=876091 RepID=UPI0025E08996|nr:secretion protein F [uncultured Oscillibacter sp.]